jgi:hypothetical protein
MAQIKKLNDLLPANVGLCNISPPQYGIWTLVSATGVTDFYLQTSLGGGNSVRYTYTPGMSLVSGNELWLDLKDLTAPVSTFNWKFTDYCGGGCGVTYDVTIVSKNNVASVAVTPATVNYGRAVLDITSGASSNLTNGVFSKVRGFLMCENNTLKLGYYLNVMTTGGTIIEEGFKTYTLPTQPLWTTTITGIANTQEINNLIFGIDVPISPSIPISTTSQSDIATLLKSRFKDGLNALYPSAWREINDLINGMTISCTKSGTTSLTISCKPHYIAEGSPSYSYPVISTGTATIKTIAGLNYNASLTCTNSTFSINPTAITTATVTCGSALTIDPTSSTYSVVDSTISYVNGFICIHSKDFTTVNPGSYFECDNANTPASTNTCNISATMQYNHNRSGDLLNFTVTQVSNNAIIHNAASNSGVINYNSPNTYKIDTTIDTGAGSCVLTKTITI